MGLNTRQYERKTYIGIIGGKFATKANADTPNAVKRFSEKKNQDVYELLYDDVTGRITDIHIEESQFGKQLIVGVNDVGDYLQVQIPVESKYFWHFAMKINYVDFNQEIMIAPYSFEDKTKKDSKGNPQKITGLNIYQPAIANANNKTQYYYTESEPKGKPMPEKDMDETDYKVFRLKEQKFLIEAVSKIKLTQHDEEPAHIANATDDEIPPVSDDLPFSIALLFTIGSLATSMF